MFTEELRRRMADRSYEHSSTSANFLMSCPSPVLQSISSRRQTDLGIDREMHRGAVTELNADAAPFWIVADRDLVNDFAPYFGVAVNHSDPHNMLIPRRAVRVLPGCPLARTVGKTSELSIRHASCTIS